MTYPELQIQFDLNHDSHVNVLKNVDTCKRMGVRYLFVDSENGQCYLFDENGQEDDISKVKSIIDMAFYNCTLLKNINIPNSVKSIGNSTFTGCTSLKSIEIPDSVNSIGKWAFENCTSLKSIAFEGKTFDEVKAMDNYPWGIKDKSVIIHKAFK